MTSNCCSVHFFSVRRHSTIRQAEHNITLSPSHRPSHPNLSHAITSRRPYCKLVGPSPDSLGSCVLLIAVFPKILFLLRLCFLACPPHGRKIRGPVFPFTVNPSNAAPGPEPHAAGLRVADTRERNMQCNAFSIQRAMLAAADDGRPAPRSSLAQDMQNKRLQTLENRGTTRADICWRPAYVDTSTPVEATEAFSRRLRTMDDTPRPTQAK